MLSISLQHVAPLMALVALLPSTEASVRDGPSRRDLLSGNLLVGRGGASCHEGKIEHGWMNSDCTPKCDPGCYQYGQECHPHTTTTAKPTTTTTTEAPWPTCPSKPPSYGHWKPGPHGCTPVCNPGCSYKDEWGCYPPPTTTHKPTTTTTTEAPWPTCPSKPPSYGHWKPGPHGCVPVCNEGCKPKDEWGCYPPEPKPCRTNVVPHGTYVTYGEKCVLECESGYYASGGRHCYPNPKTTLPNPCRSNVVEHGYYVVKGDKCVLECEYGYSPEGGRYCRAPPKTTTLPTPCRTNKVEHGWYATKDGKCVLECEWGYYAEGGRHCYKSKGW